VVFLDDACVDEGQPEEDGEEADHGAGANNGSGHGVPRQVLETQTGGSLEDDCHREDGTDKEKDNRRGEQAPAGGIFTNEDSELDEGVEDNTEATSDGRC